MQSLPYSLAHRGAARTNSRWHPYTPPRSSSGATSNFSTLLAANSTHQSQGAHEVNTYLNSPANSVYTISPASTSSSVSQTPLPFSIPPPLSYAPNQLRKTQSFPMPKPSITKANYVATLVDQAVKSLSDIWRPECIPAVFATSTQITVTSVKPPTVGSQGLQLKPLVIHQNQLPSPCSPTTQHSPYVPVHVKQDGTSPNRSTSAFLAEHFGGNAKVVSEKDLVPIRTFVQEVLRRSRTSCSVLQSALCYIEAIRRKVPCLAEKQGLNQGAVEEPELDDRIINGMETCSVSPSGIYSNANSNEFVNRSTSGENTQRSVDSLDGLPTVLHTDLDCDPSVVSLSQQIQSDVQQQRQRKIPPKPTTPLPLLPSPLLCPRRTFLAALILASKFLQDRCYSNRAWAKLSGLSPREVGRCERALGEALEWRLWVGKSCAASEEGGVPHKTRSESLLPSGPPVATCVTLNMYPMPSPPLSDAGTSPEACGYAS
ncbi:g1 s-specific cyclin [Pyrrhoderma noxium]|uniref:G1 s-specific cyclin n=1 Tax=Pyrrhoderma noxium TaxID=2282107 RepID=A0A286UGD7_9AGAM|nr:g1 s-specific cyclin [Pyrrhoderma noxium]